MSFKSDPWVLGISASPHNGAVCLLKGDEIVAAVQEERLTRRKRAPLYGANPSLAIEYCLNYAGIRPSDLSLVVSCVTNRARVPEQDLSLNPILQTKQNKIPTLYIPHHYGHAISAFGTSGFQDSATLVIDGVGSPYEDFTEDEKAACKWMVENGWETISLYGASGASIIALEKHMVENFAWIGPERDAMPTFGSLGGMYSAAAVQIFGDLFEAGKVMGLAPYGEPVIPPGEFFDIDKGRFIFHDKVPKRFRHTERWPLRRQEYSNLSSSTQVALEGAIMYLVDHLYDLFPSDNLCYAGGVALNSVTNERIIRESKFKNVYIIAAAEDSGTAIGAAYYGLWQLTGRNTRKKLSHDCVGRIYKSDEILRAIEHTPAVEMLDSQNPLSDAVDLLCDGKIIGWFEGRSELGPRALGQRSILCDARRADAKDVLNRRVKHREPFRPFAPVVLFEKVHEWFALEGASPESPFMLRICKFRDDKREQVPGVVHVDNTGRFQTITKEANGQLYSLVQRFYEKTGVPIILNTSFNVAGEPIVETPQDALNTLLSTGIDYCVLGNMIVGKRRRILFEQDEVGWPQRLKHQLAEALDKASTSGSLERRGAGAGVEQDPSAVDICGTFDNDIQGALRIEQVSRQLRATLSGNPALQLYRNMSWPLVKMGDNVFEIKGGPFAGVKLVFFKDRRERVNALAVIAQRGLPEIFLRRPTDYLSSEEMYRAFLGEYAAADKLMTVSLRENRLFASVPGQPGLELAPIKENEFVLKRLPGYAVEFLKDEAGVVTTATVTLPSEVVVLHKK